MAVCIVIYAVLLLLFFLSKKGLLFRQLREKEKKIIFVTLMLCNMIATVLFGVGMANSDSQGKLVRNAYGKGSKLENYEVTVEGELESETIEIEVEEREYTSSEIQEMFAEVASKLDEVILGENESCDRVESRLNLVESLEGYPIRIQWDWNNYDILELNGEIVQENTREEGTLVELRGRLTCGKEEFFYVTTVVIYPETKEGKEKWLQAIQDSVRDKEESTRNQEEFILPDEVLGKKVTWNKRQDVTGYYILVFGLLICGILVWKYRNDEKEMQEKVTEQMIRDYPDILNKFVLLLTTGMTVRAVWAKIVQEYEEEKEQNGKRYAYEEMRITEHEMQSGVAETESYERFGKRCKETIYIKFGALLSQNLRKGGKGLCELLKIESIQAFENRKSQARRVGEEASTKLLIPMLGMLAVVMIMVIIPAFFSIRL